MFIDEVKLTLKAWKGWDWIVSWRREKYIPKWGPYGWDGWDGWDIILRATTHETTLTKFRHLKKIEAKNGERWWTWEKHGASADNLIVDVPVWTIVTDAEDGELICDLSKNWQEFLICKGGRWGFGNAHFTSSTRQTPNFAELGDRWEEKFVKLELKLVADVGLVGLPNAWKSTLIQSLTNVKPKIANYAFTTLTPNLGVMEHKNRSLVIEDVPWLIEWASEGKGLWFQFLKHIDRCRIIIHLLDASVGEDELINNYQTIRKELENWNNEMANKEELIIFSKADIIDNEHLSEIVNNFEKKTNKKVTLTISAGAYIRTEDLKDILIEKIPERTDNEDEYVENNSSTFYDLKKKTNPKSYKIERLENNDFRVTWERIEEIARMTDTRYTDGVGRVYDVLERFGVMRKIKQILTDEMLSWYWVGFFEWEDDMEIPSVWIWEKKFSLEWLIFMRENR